MDKAITKHANERIRERMGIHKKSVNSVAERAYEKGLTHSETKGNLFKFINTVLDKNHRVGAEVRIYAEKVFVYSETKLITVLPLPANLRSIANKLYKKKNGEQ